MVYKVIIYSFLMVLFGLSALSGLIANIVGLFSENSSNDFLHEIMIVIMAGGLTYWLWVLFFNALNNYKNMDVTESIKHEVFETQFDTEESVFGKNLSDHVTPSGEYQFDYIDSAGEFSSRKVMFRSVKFKNDNYYLNAIDQNKHASRTFRIDRIYDLINLDTGEAINDAENYFQRFNR